VIELDPNDASVYFDRAFSYGVLEDYPKAIDDYTKVIELDSSIEHSRAYYGRGLAYLSLNQKAKGIDDLKMFIEVTDDENARQEVVEFLGKLQQK